MNSTLFPVTIATGRDVAIVLKRLASMDIAKDVNDITVGVMLMLVLMIIVENVASSTVTNAPMKTFWSVLFAIQRVVGIIGIVILLLEIALGASSLSVRTVPKVVVMRQICSIVRHAPVLTITALRNECEGTMQGCRQESRVVIGMKSSLIKLSDTYKQIIHVTFILCLDK